jgi:fructose-1,6-bisphosphatase I
LGGKILELYQLIGIDALIFAHLQTNCLISFLPKFTSEVFCNRYLLSYAAMLNQKRITFEQFIMAQERQIPLATGDYSRLLGDIALASKVIARELSRAGIVDIIGEFGAENVQGEAVQKMDVFANNQFKYSLSLGGQVAVMASEEEEDVVVLNDQKGKYVVLFDPLDGSSNIDTGMPVGTIFAIYRRVSANGSAGLIDCLQLGRSQIAAGYVLYGSSTVMVYADSKGVNGFTLDPTIGDFFLTFPNIRIPSTATYISVNDEKLAEFPKPIQAYLSQLQERREAKEKGLKPRYVGTLVADFHRNLIQGGLFCYPSTASHPKGKLRLNYEGNPMAFIAQQAGGKAFNGSEAILDVVPLALHQRTPLYIGNAHEIALLEKNFSQSQGKTAS